MFSSRTSPHQTHLSTHTTLGAPSAQTASRSARRQGASRGRALLAASVLATLAATGTSAAVAKAPKPPTPTPAPTPAPTASPTPTATATTSPTTSPTTAPAPSTAVESWPSQPAAAPDLAGSTLSAPFAPAGVTLGDITSDGTTLYAASATGLYKASVAGGAWTKFATTSVISHLVVHGGKVYGGGSGASLYLIDPATGALTNLGAIVAGNVADLTSDGVALYAADPATGVVRITLNTEGTSITAHTTWWSGVWATAILADKDGTVFAANGTTLTSRTAAGQVTALASVPMQAAQILGAGQNVYVASGYYSGGSVTEISLATHASTRIGGITSAVTGLATDGKAITYTTAAGVANLT